MSEENPTPRYAWWYVLPAVVVALVAMQIELIDMKRPPLETGDKKKGDGRGPFLYYNIPDPNDTIRDSIDKTRRISSMFMKHPYWRQSMFTAIMATVFAYTLFYNGVDIYKVLLLWGLVYTLITSLVGYTRFHYYQLSDRYTNAHLDNILARSRKLNRQVQGHLATQD